MSESPLRARRMARVRVLQQARDSRPAIRPRLSSQPGALPVPPAPAPTGHLPFPPARRPPSTWIPDLNEDGSNRWDVAIALLNALADGGDAAAQRLLSTWFRMVRVRNQ